MLENENEKLTVEEVNHNLRSWLLILSIVTGILFLSVIFFFVRTMAQEQKVQVQQADSAAAIQEIVLWSSENFNFIAATLQNLIVTSAMDSSADATVFVETTSSNSDTTTIDSAADNLVNIN